MSGMRSLSKAEDGFTLVELMMVVLIIGVLVAVATPVFAGLADRARDKEMQADLRSGLLAVELYYLQNGVYTDDPGLLEPMEPAVVYYSVEHPMGTVALRLAESPENDEICLFGQSVGGEWYAIYRSVDVGILYGRAELQDCSADLAVGWSPQTW
jgi:prepilin-type N-terminal cleavage/methylation domain-containing protein